LSGRFVVPGTADAGSASRLAQVQINAQNGAAFQARVANYGSDTLDNFEVSVKPFTDADETLCRSCWYSVLVVNAPWLDT